MKKDISLPPPKENEKLIRAQQKFKSPSGFLELNHPVWEWKYFHTKAKRKIPIAKERAKRARGKSTQKTIFHIISMST
jgi:hypothetical protein